MKILLVLLAAIAILLTAVAGFMLFGPGTEPGEYTGVETMVVGSGTRVQLVLGHSGDQICIGVRTIDGGGEDVLCGPAATAVDGEVSVADARLLVLADTILRSGGAQSLGDCLRGREAMISEPATSTGTGDARTVFGYWCLVDQT